MILPSLTITIGKRDELRTEVMKTRSREKNNWKVKVTGKEI